MTQPSSHGFAHPARPGVQRRALVFVLLAVLVGTLSFVASGTHAHAAGALLSQGKPVTSSSVTGANTAALAVDGDTGTRWESAQGVDPQWITVDLGSSQSIGQVVLNWETAAASAYQLQTSTDNATWTTVYSTTTSTGGVQTLNVTGTGRYVRMYGTARTTQYGYSLWEFQVYAAAAPPACGTTNAAQGKAATASSVTGANTAALAVDGNTGSRWESAYSDPQWIQVDLGASQSICGVTLNWETAAAKSFQLQTSTDATNWTSIYSTTTGTGGVQALTGLSATGRYLRMYGTARTTQYGYSLWELQIFTAGTATTTTSSPTPTATTTTPAGTTCGTTNVAQGKTATASSVTGANTAALAVDNNTGSRWESAYSDPQWIQVDLGTTQSLCKVVLNWETAAAKAYQIQTSTDATNWTTVYGTTTGAGGIETLTVAGSGRYVRMYGTARTTQYGYSLWELQVYAGSTTPTPTPTSTTTSPAPSPTTTSPTPAPTTTSANGDVLLSYNKPTVTSTYQNEGACIGCTGANAVDNDPATRWATSSVNGWVDPGWIYIDLGATAQIHSVILQWDAAYATAYQLQTSNDAANWTTIYSTTTGPGFKETLSVNGTGRYIRMYGTARSNGYGYSLWEFQVYGTGGQPIAPPPPPPNVTFPATKLVFDEEFNGAAGTTPDPSKWTAETGGGPNGELEYYTPNDNAKMDGAGNLVIEARANDAGHAYTSGRIKTQDHFSFTYGHAEARIKVSGSQGLWPAFWLLGANYPTAGWPSCGEIDIMEHVGKDPTKVYSTLHAPAYNGAGGYGSPFDIGTDFQNSFHVFAVDWNADHMTFSVDGTAFFTASKSTIESTRGPWVYDHPFFIILNNAVGGDWPGAPDATSVFPNDMKIDYVRVYQN